jgi:Family of unknown function (DUF5961)
MPDAANARPFSVRARHIDSHHARTVTERSFEAAAVAYVEDLHRASDETEISVIVRDLRSGHEHCLRIDLDTGEAKFCG